MKLTDILRKPEYRDEPFDKWVRGKEMGELEAEADELEQYRKEAGSLYDRVRALLFLSNLHQYHMVARSQGKALLPYAAVESIRSRHFEQAIGELLEARAGVGSSPALSSGLAAAYRGLAFETLAKQVRQSVRSFAGNQWMFRTGHWLDYPLRLRGELLGERPYPVLHEQTPVRMDLTHSAWSDIFFLAMDYPEGARVINISVDLASRGAGSGPRPPVEAFFRVIDEPVLRLVSVDLEARADMGTIEELFDFGADYLGLLKAAVIASGLVPSGFEGSRQALWEILYRLTGSRGLGVELVSQVNEIPKGSRLAGATNLLASLIAVVMRATGQIRNLTGPLEERDRRQVAARAILGEWLGGSGGGWQDSGGVWPGIKLIEGVPAAPGAGSRGELLPRHTVLSGEIEPGAQERLEASLVLVHGGMSQDVGPILEMCTERYLLRSEKEWEGRREAVELFDELLSALRAGEIRRLGGLTQRNYDGPIQTIIPWAANAYTEALIGACQERFGEGFWGFWMLGGMAGGGMGFVFDPAIRDEAAGEMVGILGRTKERFEAAVPFAIHPVVYDFAINREGTKAELKRGGEALLSRKYHLMTTPGLLRVEAARLSEERRTELGRVAQHYPDLTAPLFERLFPRESGGEEGSGELDELLRELGFDPQAHERLRADYTANRIGLAKNILPANVTIEDVRPGDLARLRPEAAVAGARALAEGRAGVITLAGGVGSRWTKGAGTVKALIPFHRFGGRYYNFLDVHLAKTRAAEQRYGARIPHVVTTSYLTGGPIERYLAGSAARVSRGRSIGLRLIPTAADLRYLWEVLPQQQLDEQKQKVRASARQGLVRWVEAMREGSDYRANVPRQCIHPVGHWYEFPNMLLNGVLADLLEEQPQLEYLLLHNVDTLGASLDEALLGNHMESGATFSVEVVLKQFGDHGGSLARVNGRPRLLEGLAMPGEEVEFGLRHYNSSTYWITIDPLLGVFGLRRQDLRDGVAVEEAVRRTAQRVPSYITIKEVKKRWGRGQEDIYPVAQFERLWGDMTALEEVSSAWFEVPRQRGQQLKEVGQLDAWLRDGSAAAIEKMLG
ncbi:MAG: UTP--glucose-1-phosphate uridylyltransferase [Acidobacteriota bacterium]